MKKLRIILFVVLVLLACDQITDALGGTSGVSIKIPRAMPNKRAKKSSHITIHEVKILVDRIKFHTVNDDSLDFAAGPFVIVLDSNMNFAEITEMEIPDGIYEKVSFKIHKPDPNEIVVDSDFTTNGRFSLIVTGVFDTLDFVYKIDKTLIQKLTIDPPVTISGDDQYNTTLLMETDTWFVDSSDQSDLNPLDSKDNNKIEKNIKASFKAFKDNNRDGVVD